MKKIFTILAAALFSVSMMAQTTLVQWDGTESKRIGYFRCGSAKVTYSTVKIHTNTDQVDAVKFESTIKFTEGDTHYLVVKPTTGGFKAGNVVDLALCFSNSSDSKVAKIAVYAANKETRLYLSDPGINGRTSPADPDIVSFTLEADQDSLFLGREDAGTTTFLTTLHIYEPAPTTDPVAEVTIDGKDACYNGKTITLEATTDVKADTYKWTVNGDEQTGETTSSFEFAPTADGTYSIVCYAKNEYNSDWIASATHSVVVTTKPVQTELVPVDGDITWDFNGATTAQVDGNSKDTVIYYNLDAEWADGFAADKLAGKAQYFYRGESYQAFQGYVLKFVTTVPGKVKVSYSNTGGSRAYRYVRVNGVQSAKGSADGTKIESEEFAVNAGVVNIDFNLPDPTDPQEKEGGETAGLTQCRVYKVVFTKSGETALDNTEAAVKAMKVVENGQLFILKNGVKYNAQGAVVK